MAQIGSDLLGTETGLEPPISTFQATRLQTGTAVPSSNVCVCVEVFETLVLSCVCDRGHVDVWKLELT